MGNSDVTLSKLNSRSFLSGLLCLLSFLSVFVLSEPPQSLMVGETCIFFRDLLLPKYSLGYQVLNSVTLVWVLSEFLFYYYEKTLQPRQLIKESIHLGTHGSRGSESPWPSRQGAKQQADRCGAEAVAESSHLIPTHEAERRAWLTGNGIESLNLGAHP